MYTHARTHWLSLADRESRCYAKIENGCAIPTSARRCFLRARPTAWLPSSRRSSACLLSACLSSSLSSRLPASAIPRNASRTFLAEGERKQGDGVYSRSSRNTVERDSRCARKALSSTRVRRPLAFVDDSSLFAIASRVIGAANRRSETEGTDTPDWSIRSARIRLAPTRYHSTSSYFIFIKFLAKFELDVIVKFERIHAA